MQILIKKINEAEPATVLNNVYMIFENKIDYEEDVMEFYTMDDEGAQSILTITKKELEYFRKVGD